MENFVSLSLETHLFFSRIMKEHAFFLEAGFPCKDKTWIERADWFRKQFENLLRETVRIGDGRVHESVLRSGELVTEFTIPAEIKTENLSGVPFDRRISAAEQRMRQGCGEKENRKLTGMVRQLNERAVRLLNGLIELKENILRYVSRGRLYNANYPLLIRHIIWEAKLYRDILMEITKDGKPFCKCRIEIEEFWNQIMMEHALFIWGLLDPSEEALIDKADEFAEQYKRLLEEARQQDCRCAEYAEELTEKTLEETRRYQEFKAAGTEGVLENQVASIILPLLADHVLREANHYLRILESRDIRKEDWLNGALSVSGTWKNQIL